MPKITDIVRNVQLQPVRLELPRRIYRYLLARNAVQPREPGSPGRPRKPVPPPPS